MPEPLTHQVEAFYRAALVGLRALDSRETTRRFGPDADARWDSFRGHLGPADRVDLLLRDAAVPWGPAFSPVLAFALPGIATDEPFGPDWPGLSDDTARRLWRDAQDLPHEPFAPTLDRAARALGLRAAPPLPPTNDLAATDRLVVAGATALIAAARAFADRPDLSWSDQVAVVAAAPATRHLAGLVAPLLGARGPTRLILPDGTAPADALRAAGLTGVDRRLVSQDAPAAAAAFATRA